MTRTLFTKDGVSIVDTVRAERRVKAEAAAARKAKARAELGVLPPGYEWRETGRGFRVVRLNASGGAGQDVGSVGQNAHTIQLTILIDGELKTLYHSRSGADQLGIASHDLARSLWQLHREKAEDRL